jgi:hypothetical protein
LVLVSSSLPFALTALSVLLSLLGFISKISLGVLISKILFRPCWCFHQQAITNHKELVGEHTNKGREKIDRLLQSSKANPLLSLRTLVKQSPSYEKALILGFVAKRLPCRQGPCPRLLAMTAWSKLKTSLLHHKLI